MHRSQTHVLRCLGTQEAASQRVACLESQVLPPGEQLASRAAHDLPAAAGYPGHAHPTADGGAPHVAGDKNMDPGPDPEGFGTLGGAVGALQAQQREVRALLERLGAQAAAAADLLAALQAAQRGAAPEAAAPQAGADAVTRAAMQHHQVGIAFASLLPVCAHRLLHVLRYLPAGPPSKRFISHHQARSLTGRPFVCECALPCECVADSDWRTTHTPVTHSLPLLLSV